MLTQEGCRSRQIALADQLKREQLDAAVFTDPRDIYYFTGWLREAEHPAALVVGDRITLIAAETPSQEKTVIDEVITYEAAVYATVQLDRVQRLVSTGKAVLNELDGKRVGYRKEDLPQAIVDTVSAQWTAIDDAVVAMQSVKLPDEIACIRKAIEATEAGYQALKEAVRPGLNELEAFAIAYGAILNSAGAIVPYAGDFQSNSMGGRARNRAIEAGELYILDTFPTVHGYWADMSRVFAVGGSPSNLQLEAWEWVVKALEVGEQIAGPGVSAREVHRRMEEVLAGFKHPEAKLLPHHGGHGIGLRAHELPRVDPVFDDMFEVGMTFTLEPGVYHPDLRAGIRLEQNYLVTEDGVERLSSFPLELT